MKLSLWLTPRAEDAREIAASILRCSATFGTPPFPPHVTLASAKVRKLLRLDEFDATHARALTLTLGAPEFGSEYFHSMFLPVAMSEGLEPLVERASTWLSANPLKHPPHLSLAYGLGRAEQQQALALAPAAPAVLVFDQLELWDTGGEVQSWSKREARTLPRR